MKTFFALGFLALISLSAHADCKLRVHRQDLNEKEWLAAKEAFSSRGYTVVETGSSLWQNGDAEVMTNAASKKSNITFAQTSIGLEEYFSEATGLGEETEE